MALLIAGTQIISQDEPCLGLYEYNLQAPDSHGFRRYQVIYVIRGDRPTECRRDLGLASNFKAEQFRIPGGVVDYTTGKGEIVHTVGELMDIADSLRADGIDYGKDFRPRDLKQMWYDQMEEALKRRRGASTIGPNVRIQRSV